MGASSVEECALSVVCGCSVHHKFTTLTESHAKAPKKKPLNIFLCAWLTEACVIRSRGHFSLLPPPESRRDLHQATINPNPLKQPGCFTTSVHLRSFPGLLLCSANCFLDAVKHTTTHTHRRAHTHRSRILRSFCCIMQRKQRKDRKLQIGDFCGRR